MRKNPLVLRDKEVEFLNALVRMISIRTRKKLTTEDVEFSSFIDDNNDSIVRTEFVFEWSVRDDADCKVRLEFSTLREIFEYDSHVVRGDSIGQIYSKYNVLLDKGWVPNVDGFYISSLVVSPHCRGKGYGLDVLEMVMELATRYDVHLAWTFDDAVNEKQVKGSNAIENLKSWYKKSGALFSPIASELGFYDFIYPTFILDAYKGLVFDEEPIKRLNPGEAEGVIIPGFPRQWWYTDNDAKIMFQAMQRQFDDPDNYWNDEFIPDMDHLIELRNSLAEQRLIDLLEKSGAEMVGLSPDWASIAYELDGGILIQEDHLDEMPWSLLQFTGNIDPDTDLPEYVVAKTENAEHYLEKLLPEEYADFLADHGAEPLQFPIRSNKGVSSVKIPKKVIRDSKGRKIPQKYLAGYKGKKLTQRKKEIEQRRDEYKKALQKYNDEDNFPKSVIKKLYRPFKTDKGIKSKPSSYTVEAKKRGFTGSIANKAKQASKYYGGKIPQSILKEVNARGMAAWASGGHRPGQTSHSWGIARVNSFLVGGKTFFTADKNLAAKLPEKVQKAIKKKRHWKGN